MQDYWRDPEMGGLNNEALSSLRELWSFSFLLSLSCKHEASPKRKSPDAAHRGFVVAGAGFEPTAFGL